MALWTIVETSFGPDLRLFDEERDVRGLEFEEARNIIVLGYKFHIEDWMGYTEEEFLEREQ